MNDCLKGRIDNILLEGLFKVNKSLKEADSYFLCGPGKMIDNVNKFLEDLGVNANKINFERFTSGIVSEDNIIIDTKEDEIISNVIVSVDGDDFNFEFSMLLITRI